MKIIIIEIPELGNRSYLVHDGSRALVIDPSRRFAQIEDTAKSEGVNIEAVFETHIHNDYVSGGLALSEHIGAKYYLSADDETKFKHEPINAGDDIVVGKLKVSVILSPGHTKHHLSYLVDDGSEEPALFSGGSLLYGSVGRTDLISTAETEVLARKQYQTARRYETELKKSTRLYPTHGFGSFCAAGETDNNDTSTLGSELKTNRVYLIDDEDKYVRELIDTYDDYPSYYRFMGPANLAGAKAWPGEPLAVLDNSGVKSALHAGAGIVDLRNRLDYAKSHMKGSYNIEYGDSVATYTGWLLPWEEPVVFVAEKIQQADQAAEQLSLIGRDNVSGKAEPIIISSLMDSRYDVASFEDLMSVEPESLSLVDVRRTSEWNKAHVGYAVHIPLHELRDKLARIPRNKPVWVHCAAGFRAAMAASILSANAYDVVLIDDVFDNAVRLRLVETEDNGLIEDVANGKVLLVDVREDDEWNQGHAEGALHIQLGRILADDFSELNKDKKVYLYCKSGGRAGMAASYLEANGYDTLNIGGLADWQAAGGAVTNQ